ncbi:MAG: MarR family transcriptional regulator, partial [Armatimonadetes bacterium]|nr:MarR family transcriptional regulator [Armatimonadota bacterium]
MAEERNRDNGSGQAGGGTDPRRRILVALRRVGRVLDIHSRRLAAESNVTSVQLFTLKMLSLDGVDTATEVARRVHLSPSTVVGILDRLEEKDYIERRRDTMDRRVVRVTLTPAGREVIRITPHPVEDLLGREFEGLTDPDAERVAEAMEMLVRALGA